MKPYYKNELTTIYNGDCLEVMDYLIEQGIKVDAIITDPPYGSINGLKLKGFKETVTWDKELEWDKIWIRLNELTKLNSNIILFNQMPYSYKMIKHNIKDLHHEIIWEKNNCAQGMFRDIMPLKFHENIYIFRKRIDRKIQNWFYNEFIKTGYTYKQFNEEMGYASNGGGVASATFSIEKDDWQFPTIENYSKIQSLFPHQFNIKYDELSVSKSYYGAGEKSVIRFTKDMTGMHPTQKPLELMKYLIETYTKKGDLILDFTAGSFTTCVGAEQLNRRSIGIELEKKYCDVGVKRLSQLQMRLDI